MHSKFSYAYPYLLIGLISLALFSALSFGVEANLSIIQAIDQDGGITENINSTSTLSRFMIDATEIGNIKLIIALTIIVSVILFFKKYYSAGLWFGGTVLFGAVIVTKILKTVFDRQRPQVQQLIEKTTESYPSGHATGTTAFYALLVLIAILFVHKGWKRTALIIGPSAIILFVLVSRVYLGVHYPTDVIGGFLLGFGAVNLSVGLYILAETKLAHLLEKLGLSNKRFTLSYERTTDE